MKQILVVVLSELMNYFNMYKDYNRIVFQVDTEELQFSKFFFQESAANIFQEFNPLNFRLVFVLNKQAHWSHSRHCRQFECSEKKRDDKKYWDNVPKKI